MEAASLPASEQGDHRTTYPRLLDIVNVEAFVEHHLTVSRIRFEDGEREDLHAEGLRILYELAGRFEPHRAGYAQAGRFSGFAAAYLPKRLADAWHARHEHHRYATQADGSRRWEYDRPPVSLHAMTGDDPEGADHLLVAREAPQSTEDFMAQLRKSLWDGFELEIEECARVAIMRADGMSQAQIAEEIGKPLADVRNAEARLSRALERLM